jgi:hypothetical protein
MFIADLLAAPAEIVVATELQHIGGEVVAFNHQVLHYRIDHRVRNLNARNGDVARVFEDGGHDHIADILQKMLLEHRLTILIGAEVVEQLLQGRGEGLVLWVVVELISKEFSLVHDAVGMFSIAFPKKILSLVVQLVPLFIGLILEDIPLLFQTFADEFVDRLEPILQFGIALGIGVDVLDRVEEIIGAGGVGEAFDESLEFCQRFFVGLNGS